MYIDKAYGENLMKYTDAAIFANLKPFGTFFSKKGYHVVQAVNKREAESMLLARSLDNPRLGAVVEVKEVQ